MGVCNIKKTATGNMADIKTSANITPSITRNKFGNTIVQFTITDDADIDVIKDQYYEHLTKMTEDLNENFKRILKDPSVKIAIDDLRKFIFPTIQGQISNNSVKYLTIEILDNEYRKFKDKFFKEDPDKYDDSLDFNIAFSTTIEEQSYLEKQAEDFKLNMDTIKFQREQYRKAINDRIRAIVAALKSGGLTQSEISDLNKKERMLNEILQNLNEDLLSIRNKKINLDRMLQSSLRDFSVIEAYLNNEPLDLSVNQVEELLDFYSRVSDLNNNPILDTTDMLNSDGSLKDEYRMLIDILSRVSSRAKELQNKLLKKKDDTALAIINSNSNIKDNKDFQDLTIDDYIHLEEGLPDITKYDAWMNNITNTTFRQNGLIPQVMQMKLEAKMAEYTAHVTKLSKELEEIRPDLEKALADAGLTWNDFYEVDKNGLRTGRIISPYSDEYQKALASMRTAYSIALSNAYKKKGSYKDGKLAAQSKRILWYKDNTKPLKVHLIPELLEDNNEPVSQEAFDYKKELINDYGVFAYEDLVNNQRIKNRLFKSDRGEFVEKLIDRYNSENSSNPNFNPISTEEELMKSANVIIKNTLISYDNLNDPSIIGKSLNNAYNYYSNLSKDNKIKPEFSLGLKYIEVIPLKSKFNVKINSNVNTNYTNNKFKSIESNEKLLKFYRILHKNQKLIKDLLPLDKQERLGDMSLMAAKKTFWEMLNDHDMNFLLRFTKAMKYLWEKFKLSFTSSLNHSFTTGAKLNPITGEKMTKISDRFFSSVNDEVEDIVDKQKMILMNALGVTKFGLFKTKTFDISNNQTAIQIFADLLGVSRDANTVASKLGLNDLSSVNIHNELQRAAREHVMAEQSVDLPKLLRFQLNQVAMYRARLDVYDDLKLMKEYHENIKDEKGGLRKNSIEQMESWFNRVVLDNYESKDELRKADAINKIADKIKDSNKIFSEADKKKKAELEAVIESLTSIRKDLKDSKDPSKKPEIESIDRMLDKSREELKYLGNYISLKGIVDSFFNFIRFKALAWNVRSQIPNFLEGQISNILSGERGIFYSTDEILRANRIVNGSLIRTLSNKNINPEGAVKAKLFVDKFDIQLDATNELQKASKASTLDKASNIGPYELLRRVEYLNQAPVLVAMMINKKIKGVDENGNEIESSVWDALDTEGKLKKGFDSEANKKTWEQNNSDEYFAFKSKVTKAIIENQGDYHKLRGNMAKEYMLGKAGLMLKTWMTSMIYTRWGAEQYDLETGQIVKGRHRSFSTAQLTMFLGLAGAMFSPVFAVAGLGIGALIGTKLGLGVKAGIVKDFAQNIKGLLVNMIRIPVNTITLGAFGSISQSKLDLGIEPDSIDYKNMQANLAEMAIMMWYLTLGLIARAMLSGGGDDDDDKYMLHYFINTLNQLSGQILMYISPYDMYNQALTQNAIIGTLTQVGKVSNEIVKFSFGDESKVLENSRGLLMPSIMRDHFGFGPNDRIYESRGIDELFKDSETKAKNKKTALKQKYVDEINDSDLSERQKDRKKKRLTKIFKKKKRDSQERSLEKARRWDKEKGDAFIESLK